MMWRCQPVKWFRARYFDRGISVCERWHDVNAFIQDMGPLWKPGLELDRIDNDKGYSPENCRFISHKEQMNNTRRSRVIEYLGRKMSLSEFAGLVGRKPNTIIWNLRRGWSINEIAEGERVRVEKPTKLGRLANELISDRAAGMSLPAIALKYSTFSGNLSRFYRLPHIKTSLERATRKETISTE